MSFKKSRESRSLSGEQLLDKSSGNNNKHLISFGFYVFFVSRFLVVNQRPERVIVQLIIDTK